MSAGFATNFLANFKNGIANQNRFMVEFNLPKGPPWVVGNKSVGVDRFAAQGAIQQKESTMNAGGRINVKCHTATMPQRSLLTSEVRMNSAPFRIPHSATYDPVTFSFYADGNMDTRTYFDIWQAAVCNMSTNTMNFLDEYTSDMKIHMLDTNNRKNYSVVLYEAWPMNIGVVEYSYSNQNNYQTITVTMAYKSWLDEKADGGGANRTNPGSRS